MTPARALVATALLLFTPRALAWDSGWNEDSAGGGGPRALAPLPHDFSGPTDQLAIGVDIDILRMTYLPGSREDAAAGVLLPAPAGVQLEDIARVDPEAFEDLDRFTRPWLWRETCGQALSSPSAGCGSQDDGADRGSDESSGCGGGPGFDTADTGASGGDGSDPDRVTFSLGEYDGWLLQDTTPEAALAMLSEEGIAVPDGAAASMATVLAEGNAIIALRLDPEAPTDGWASPSAIQIRQARTEANLRLWPALGTLGGEHTRDLLLFGLHEDDAWAPDLAEAGVPSDCLLETASDVGAPMATAWQAVSGVTAEGGAPALTWDAWMPDSRCHDCGPHDGLSDLVARRLLGPVARPALTRTRLRYHRPQAADPVPLVRPESPPFEGVRRLIDHRWELESAHPRCDATPVDAPGTCFGAAWWAHRAAEPAQAESIPQRHDRCGPRRTPAALLLLAPLLLAGIRRRR